MRGWITWTSGFLLCLLVVFMVVMFSLNSANGWGELLGIATFFTPICYLISIFTLFPYVRATSSGLVVVNPDKIFRIPWRNVRELSADQGLYVELTNGEKVYSFAFQVSMIGKFLRYPGARRAVRKMEKIRAKGVDSGGGLDVDSAVPWRRHTSFVMGFWVTFALIIPSLVRLP
ncbi:hypothetical protein [Salinispora fenicalii]|uniref:hypothetical protein n=1 Tax=Salinispora fenicalii TaxID=1137263 RepID=UPI0012BC8BCD|nr:hypothetical protein [Salinispora fenicalii]